MLCEGQVSGGAYIYGACKDRNLLASLARTVLSLSIFLSKLIPVVHQYAANVILT